MGAWKKNERTRFSFASKLSIFLERQARWRGRWEFSLSGFFLAGAGCALARKTRIFQLHGSYMAVTCGAGHFVGANEKVNGAKGRYRLFYLSDLWRNVKAAASFFFL